MNSEPIPKSVAAFIADYIESLVELEALLLLFTHRDRVWTSSEIARELRIDRSWPQSELQGLCTRGILRCTPGAETTYQFAPRDPAMEQVVAHLAAAYADRRVTIIGLIFSKPVDKLKTFADAFRIRKDPEK